MPKISVSIDGKEVGFRNTPDATYAEWTKRRIAQRNQIVVTPAVPEVPAVLNDDGTVKTPAVPAVPAVTQPYTAEQVVALIFDDTYRDDIEKVNQEIADESAAAAKAAVEKLALG